MVLVEDAVVAAVAVAAPDTTMESVIVPEPDLIPLLEVVGVARTAAAETAAGIAVALLVHAAVVIATLVVVVVVPAVSVEVGVIRAT